MDEKVGDTFHKDTFSYQAKPIVAVYFPVLVGGLVIFSILVGEKYSFHDGAIFLLALVPFLFLLWFVSMQGYSDVVLEDDGLSRNMYGWTWQKLSWKEISCIKIRSSRTRTGVVTILVFVSKPSATSGKIRRIAFSKDIDMLGKLVNRINELIAKFHISVVDERSGVVTQVDRLPFLTQDRP